MLETDVRRSADGRLVLAHDPLPGGRAGTAPPLGAVLNQAHRRASLDLELKEAGYEREFLAEISPYPEGLIVTSFLPRAVAAVRRLAPAIPAGLLLHPRTIKDPLELATACDSRLVGLHIRLARGDVLERAAGAGLPAAVWTVNSPSDLRRLCRNPAVAVIITDRPERALEIRAAVGRRGPNPFAAADR